MGWAVPINPTDPAGGPEGRPPIETKNAKTMEPKKQAELPKPVDRQLKPEHVRVRVGVKSAETPIKK